MNTKLFRNIIIICVSIIVIGYGIYCFIDYINYKKRKSAMKFPPWPAKCPDYWTYLGNEKCKNTFGIGKCNTSKGDNTQVMDFKDNPVFAGTKGLMAKCKWAKGCDTAWEGIDQICT